MSEPVSEPSRNENLADHSLDADRLQFSIDHDAADVAAWTEIEQGRFLPRRVRGSFQGRALG